MEGNGLRLIESAELINFMYNNLCITVNACALVGYYSFQKSNMGTLTTTYLFFTDPNSDLMVSLATFNSSNSDFDPASL